MPMPGTARRVIGIVAAYPSLRAGLGTLIQQDPGFMASAISPEMVLAWSQMPATAAIADMDAVLIDPRDLAPEILNAIVQIAQVEDIPLLWLGHHGRLPDAATANVPGGVISSHADGDTLIAAIRAVRVGLRVFDPELEAESGSVALAATSPSPGTVQALSPREHEVLELVASGLPNKAIARTLGISDHTVKFHVSSVLTKLDAASRTEAVTIATRTGILSL
jgi:DNA-binding NarL/FixJ family response regulator